MGRFWGGTAAALAVLVSLGADTRDAGAMEFNGYLEESVAGRVSQFDDIIFHRQTLNLKLQHRPSRKFQFRGELDLWIDSPDFMDENPQGRHRIRELYFKFGVGNWDVRVGRKQIAWGEAEGAVVSDQVSPFDFENFITAEFDAIRQGVDGIFADYYFDNGNELQLIWISHFQPIDLPEQNSPWQLFDADAFIDAGITLNRVNEPGDSLQNGEIGIRYSGHPLAADWSVGYLWAHDDRPSLLFQDLVCAAPPCPTSVTPTIDRYHLVTANVVAPVGDYLIKFDTAFEGDRFLSLDPNRGVDPTDAGLIADGFRRQTHVWRGLLGLEMKPDVPYWEQAEASFQYIHTHIFDDHPSLTEPQDQDLLSVRLTAGYRNDTIKPWLFAIYDPAGDNWWLQAKVEYEPSQAVELTLEYDMFEGHAFDGDNGGIYGQYDDNDLLKFTARYTF